MAVADAPSPAAAAPAACAPPAGALVLGGDYRALGVVRSLGRRGVPVWVIRDGDDVLAARSRYARRRLDWPRSGADAQLAFLLGLADAGADGFALIPSGDETAAFVARHHAVLSARYALRRQRLRRDPARAACRSALVLDGLADLAEDERDARGDRPQRPVEVAAIVRWADAHGAGYDAWAWDTWGTCSALVGDYAGAPHGAYGRWAHAHYSRNRVAPLRVRR